MGEMLDDTLQMEDDEELEEEADAEVDKVLYDLTEGKLGQAGTVKEELPVSVLVQCMVRLGILIPGVSANTEPGGGRGAGGRGRRGAAQEGGHGLRAERVQHAGGDGGGQVLGGRDVRPHF